MADRLSGERGVYAHPHDPADFGRCLGLLIAVPEFRPRLAEMSNCSSQWSAIVAAWNELETLYNEEFPTGRAPRCYAKMKELLQE
jgi:hypothetical protein